MTTQDNTTWTTPADIAKAFKQAPKGSKKTLATLDGDGVEVFDSPSHRETSPRDTPQGDQGDQQGQEGQEAPTPQEGQGDENGAPEATEISPEGGESNVNGAPGAGESFADMVENLQNAAGGTFPPDVLRAFAVSVVTKQPFLLIGETGTGKTTLIRAGAEYMKKTLYRVNLNGQTGREDLVGRYVLKNNATEWQDGLLVHAMRHGYWILLDELNAALPEVLFCLQAVTERRNGELGTLILTEHDGEAITPHPDFRIFATCNPPSYVGLKDLNTATLSRFIAGHMPMMSLPDAQRHFTNLYTGVTPEHVGVLYEIIQGGLTLFQEGEVSYCPSMRDIDHICAMVEGGLTMEEAITFGMMHKVMMEEERKKLEEFTSKTLASYDAYVKSKAKVQEVITHKQELSQLFSQLKDMGGVPDAPTIEKLRHHVEQLAQARNAPEATEGLPVEGNTMPF